MEKVDQSGDCWLWTGASFRRGYGAFRLGDKLLRAHRWAYEHFVEPIPEGVLVMHTCDTPACVNPKHLLLGTQLENQQDMTRKGRGRTGLRHGMVKHPPKLTRALADEIRERYAAKGVTQQNLADEYGVCRQMISMILRGERWAW